MYVYFQREKIFPDKTYSDFSVTKGVLVYKNCAPES